MRLRWYKSAALDLIVCINGSLLHRACFFKFYLSYQANRTAKPLTTTMLSANSSTNLNGNAYQQCVNDFNRLNTANAWALILANMTTIPITITLNLLVVICITRTERLRSKCSTVLLAHLAVTDVLVGVVAQPSQIAFVICFWSKECNFCFLEFIGLAPTVFLMFLSLLHLDIVAVERYIGIKHALMYGSIVTQHKLKVAVIAAWIISTCLFLFNLVPSESNLHDIIYLTLLSIFVFVIIFCYTFMFRESWRQKKLIHAQLGPEQNASRTREFKAMRTTALVVGSVMLSVGAIILFKLVLYAINVSETMDTILWFCFLTSLNSLVNPLIYFWRVDDLRATVKRFLKCY